ncbi:MAG TPA: hypothetical protein VFW97_04235 [Acidimicrobiia bacterium]|nr:hypothetical protein [Acidimicrobiia bacterium]
MGQTTTIATRPPTRERAAVTAWPMLLVWMALMVWMALIVAAHLVLVDLVQSGAHLRIPFPPLDAALDWRPGYALVLPLAVGVVVVRWAATVCARASWRFVVVGASLVTVAWDVSLALLDGFEGIVGSVTLKNEYFLDVARVRDPVAFLGGFTAHIAEYRIHVQGHPPGFLLLLSLLDRIGLGSPWVVAAIEIAGSAVAVAAVLVTVRDVAGEHLARRAAPFVAVAPVAIWMVTSADAFFAGVGACAVALVVLATARTGVRSTRFACAGGVLFGAVMFLSYGLVLLAIIPTAVALHRRRLQPLVAAGLGAAAVVAAFAVAGFWWLDGLEATRARYAAGVASRRPYWPFLLADIACLAVVLGPAIAVALARLRDRRMWWVVGGALVAIAVAAVSGMSKGEVERIWLPFAIWVLPAGAVLAADRRGARWLGAQVGFTIFLQTLVRSPW